jgi:predicted ABC-type ATPase
LPEILSCKEFINADEIARGLSPFQPDKMAFEAGRTMIARVDQLLAGGVSFALETTLSTLSYKQKILKATEHGYQVTLLFLWLESVELAFERVRTRVIEGGHNIEAEVIRRRYYRGIKNLFEIYLSIVDGLYIFDNSEVANCLIAQRIDEEGLRVLVLERYDKLQKVYDEIRETKRD